MWKLRKVRQTSQIFFFSLILITIIWVNTRPSAYSLSSDWFLRLNPLIALLAGVASRAIILSYVLISLVTLIITAIFGRVFCSFFCPLGSTIDFFDRYILKKPILQKEHRPGKGLQQLKYGILFILIVLAAFGYLFPLITDPLSIFTRIVTILLYPLIWLLKNIGLGGLRPLWEFLGIESAVYNNMRPVYMYGTEGALFLFALILAGSFWDKRFWCQYVCPTGAFLGITGRFARFKRRVVQETCDTCRFCEKKCPTRAIPERDYYITNGAECVVCGICTDRNHPCSSFDFGPHIQAETLPADLNRRQLITGVAGAACLLPVFKTDAKTHKEITGRLIRPPGALPEQEFLGRCLSCGNCMKVCPTSSIQPGGLEFGLGKWFTPRIVPRIGGCEEKCHICGHACPTDALRTLTYEEKRFVKIGTAVLNRHRCLPWEQNKVCLVCDEVCPYNAISIKWLDTTTGPFKVPVVDEDLCLGCGLCEHRCPISGEAAITVFNFSENRRSKGPYVSDYQKNKIIEKRKKFDRNFDSESGKTDVGKEDSGYDGSSGSQDAGKGSLPE